MFPLVRETPYPEPAFAVPVRLMSFPAVILPPDTTSALPFATVAFRVALPVVAFIVVFVRDAPVPSRPPATSPDRLTSVAFRVVLTRLRPLVVLALVGLLAVSFTLPVTFRVPLLTVILSVPSDTTPVTLGAEFTRFAVPLRLRLPWLTVITPPTLAPRLLFCEVPFSTVLVALNVPPFRFRPPFVPSMAYPVIVILSLAVKLLPL